jgi:alkylhydroperoxidase/carboxymuconolactone decarboxylase family protein YurZ
MSENPLDDYKKIDPELIKFFEKVQDVVLSEGALPQKYKFLIAMAIDVDYGALQGAIALGKRAIAHGATKKEVIETVRVADYIGGTGALHTSAMALQNLFKI